jgi:hypothetical protein
MTLSFGVDLGKRMTDARKWRSLAPQGSKRSAFISQSRMLYRPSLGIGASQVIWPAQGGGEIELGILQSFRMLTLRWVQDP